jgi:phenylalanyl-tRNA synthetase alpha subunit
MTDYKTKIKALAERKRLATTDEERAAVGAEMNALRSENEQAFTEALESLIKDTAEDVQVQRMAERLGERCSANHQIVTQIWRTSEKIVTMLLVTYARRLINRKHSICVHK